MAIAPAPKVKKFNFPKEPLKRGSLWSKPIACKKKIGAFLPPATVLPVPVLALPFSPR